MRRGFRDAEGGGVGEEEGVEALSEMWTFDREDGGVSAYEVLAVQDGFLLELFAEGLQWDLSSLR